MSNAIGISLPRLARSRAGDRQTQKYAVNGKVPGFTADFVDNYYFGHTSLSSAITHARAGNATMTDSDGYIKWAPHNLLTYSEDFSQWSTLGTGSLTAGQTAPDGSATATLISNTSDFRVYSSIGFDAGEGYTRSIWAKVSTEDVAAGRTDVYLTGNYQLSPSTLTTLTDEWVRYDVEVTSGTGIENFHTVDFRQSGSEVTATNVYIWGAHLYRSDLGGMVDNPERGDSYVPTTSSAVYLPRVGHHVYNGNAFVNEGVLAESEARTNLFTESEKLSEKDQNLNTTDNAIISPDGTQTASFCVPTTAFVEHFIDDANVTIGTDYAISCFAKQGPGDYLLAFRGAGIGGDAPRFDLATGTIDNEGASSFWSNTKIEDVGNGWYRCSAIGNPNSTSPLRFQIVRSDGAHNFAGDGTSGLYIWGCQIEATSSPRSSYIPTSGSSVTRAAETFTIPSANLPWPTVSPLSVSIQQKGRVTYANTWTSGTQQAARIISWTEDGDNRITLSIDQTDSAGERLTATQEESNVTDYALLTDFIYEGVLQSLNVAVRCGSTFVQVASNGQTGTANLSPTALPDLSSTDLELAYNYMGTISEFRIWDRDITDDGLEEATS